MDFEDKPMDNFDISLDAADFTNFAFDDPGHFDDPGMGVVELQLEDAGYSPTNEAGLSFHSVPSLM